MRRCHLEHVGAVYNLETETGAYIVGGVVVHNCQGVAAETFHTTIDRFPAWFRLGVSADETRADRMEPVIYDVMGKVVYEMEREDLEAKGVITPVQVHVVPSPYEDPAWMAGGRDMAKTRGRMSLDDGRNAQIVAIARRMLAAGQSPLFVFVHLRDHAKHLSDVLFYEAGIPCGLLLGGEEDAVRFAEDRDRLERGDIQVACGTYAAIGQGIDVPNVRGGIAASPIGDNRQFFGQVSGRLCRASPGKRAGHLVYLWDDAMFGRQLKRLREWSHGRAAVVEMDQLDQLFAGNPG